MMPHCSHKRLATLISIVIFSCYGFVVAHAQAQSNQQRTTSTAPANVELRRGEVLFNFQRADIEAVVKTVSQMTGRNFILDPRVKGKVTIISASPVSKGAAYQIFVSAIKAQGFTTVSAPGGTIKIVPVAEAKQNADFSARRPGPVEQVITHVVIIENGEATQLVPLLRPLMAPTSQLSAYAAANALIITDYADNVRRLLSVIQQVDQPSTSEVTVIPLENASALDIAELISQLASGTTGPVRQARVAGQQQAAQAEIAGERFSVVPDLRTNSLLIRTDNPGRLVQLRSLIAKLDVPARAGGHTRVIYLKNADAVQLAEVLRGLLAGEAGLVTPVRGTTAPAAATAAKGTAAGSLVQADEATNSLIIQAPDGIYNNLRAVIEKLDIRRAQVFVETLIAAIATDKLRDIGLQWAAAGSAGNTGILGISNAPQSGRGIINTIIDPTGTLVNAAGLTLAFLGGETTLPDGTTVRSLAGLAHALDQKGYGTILSTPNILTMDNAEAKITVAQNVPFITGSFAQASGVGSTVNPFQTIERQDVGIVLKVKPQITEGNAIKLEVFQEVSNVDQTPVTGASDITTQKRTVETTVLVDNGNTVVLGGLLDEQFTQDEQGVAGISSVPVIGGLFKTKKKTKSKTNLMVFLRPSIIRRTEDTADITRNRYTGMLDDKRAVNPGPSQVLDSFSADAVVRYPARESDYEKLESGKPTPAELLGPPEVEENVPGAPSAPQN